MKPLGISMGLNERGISLRVNQITKTEDAIWDAVETAIRENWSPEQFKNEVIMAWESTLKDYANDARKVFEN